MDSGGYGEELAEPGGGAELFDCLAPVSDDLNESQNLKQKTKIQKKRNIKIKNRVYPPTVKWRSPKRRPSVQYCFFPNYRGSVLESHSTQMVTKCVNQHLDICYFNNATGLPNKCKFCFEIKQGMRKNCNSHICHLRFTFYETRTPALETEDGRRQEST